MLITKTLLLGFILLATPGAAENVGRASIRFCPSLDPFDKACDNEWTEPGKCQHVPHFERNGVRTSSVYVFLIRILYVHGTTDCLAS